jgi:septum formation inhibitor MinC
MEQEYTEKLEAATKTYRATVMALRVNIDDVKQKHKKEIAELEAGIRSREVDVKLREEAVKVKEQELKAQSRRTTTEGKESGKEMKLAKAQWEKQLEAAEDKVTGLEGELKSANDAVLSDFTVL